MKVYFPKLDTLRFFAFLIVFISHIFFFLFDASQSTVFWQKYGSKIFGHGEVGVHIFFTLSGFLIMFLALKELQKNSSFSVAGFFKRRILRIWPLYFLVLSVGFLISNVPEQVTGCFNKFWYFLGNTCVAQVSALSSLEVHTITPLWSISVEEQFYIVFPFLFLYFAWSIKNRFPFRKLIIAIIAVSLILFSFLMRYINADNWSYISYATASVLPSLFAGIGLGYVVYRKKDTYIARIQKKSKRWFLTATLLFFSALYLKYQGSVGVALYIAPLACATGIWICLGIKDSSNMNTVDDTRLKPTVYLGKISYGLYVYHMFMMVFVNKVFSTIPGSMSSLTLVIAKAVVVFSTTVLIAHLSYRYVEKWFLSFK